VSTVIRETFFLLPAVARRSGVFFAAEASVEHLERPGDPSDHPLAHGAVGQVVEPREHHRGRQQREQEG